jgi:hypothetical protein
MIFRAHVLGSVTNAYRDMSEYFRDIRSFFEVISVRLSIAEYGVRLRAIAGNELSSNANSYLLSDDSSYPYYLWLPTWLGCFYIDPDRLPAGTPIDDCPTAQARLIAFVWPWLGFNDAYVNDADQPECWFGVTIPRPGDPNERVHTTANTIFNHFRIERTCESETDGWLTGGFRRNEIGCDLHGHWYMRRAPLATLTSYYQVEQHIIRPLGEKFSELAAIPDSSSAPPAVVVNNRVIEQIPR